MTLVGQKICVLGAGIGGLSAALALALRGARVTVLEQAEDIREVGAGLQISPNGFAVLRALGLAEALISKSPRGAAVELCDYRASKPLLRLDLTRLEADQGYYFVHRADLVELLAAAARAAGVKIRFLQKVDTVELGETIQVVTAQGATRTPDILIGADGVHSILRQSLNGVNAPFFTGQVAWRATVPVAASCAKVARVHMAPGRHLVSYPLRDGRLMNIVGVEERHSWAAESWSQQDDPAKFRAAFAGFEPRVTELLDQVETVHLWGLFRHPVAPVWHKGKAAILGDAAHPTLPFLAQGANMALEDAWVLADCLSICETVDAGLAAYQARRFDRVSRVIEAANKNARNYHLRFAPLRLAAHTALRLGGAIAPDMALKRFDWLYREDVTAA